MYAHELSTTGIEYHIILNDGGSKKIKQYYLPSLREERFSHESLLIWYEFLTVKFRVCVV